MRSGEDWAAWLHQVATPDSPRSQPSALARTGHFPAGVWEALGWLARRRGYAVDRGNADGVAGSNARADHRISIRPDLGEPSATLALLHTLAHVILQDPGGPLPCAGAVDCGGVRKIEADSAAFIVAARLGLQMPPHTWPAVTSWAGSDPRARPEATTHATMRRVTAAVSAITDHLDTALFGRPAQATEEVPGHDVGPADVLSATSHLGDLRRVLLDAEQFFVRCRSRGWAQPYLTGRGFGRDVIAQWHIGYAPPRWTALTSHLREVGYGDEVILAAGLARRSSRGNLIDYFRDRVILAVRDEHGELCGFTGRAHPAAERKVPKYLNSPETAAYRKSQLLFGLSEARHQLARGATPVIVEGAFDVIAVAAIGSGRYAPVAPCGTALTHEQVAALGRTADFGDRVVLVALDGDRAGWKAALRAYRLLSTVTTKPLAAILPDGSDPAGVLEEGGPAALHMALDHAAEPLAGLVIDDCLDSWSPRLSDPEGQLLALRDAAALIASLLPSATGEQIRHITGDRELYVLDDLLRPVANPELAMIARALPPGAVCQVVRTAQRLGAECSDVTAEIANAVRAAAKTSGRRTQAVPRPARLTSAGFPHSPSPGAAPTSAQLRPSGPGPPANLTGPRHSRSGH